MEIGPLGNKQQPFHTVKASSPKKKDTVNEVRREDKLELSSVARQQLAELADKARSVELADEKKVTHDTASTKREEKIRLARERIESGFYESSDVKGGIADKIVEQFFKESTDE